MNVAKTKVCPARGNLRLSLVTKSPETAAPKRPRAFSNAGVNRFSPPKSQ